MPICLVLKKPLSANGGPATDLHVLQDTAVAQPSDLTQCALVGFTGQEYGASVMLANASAGKAVNFPLAGEYFGWAFGSTLTLWAVAYGAGRLIDLIKKDRF